MEAYCIKTPEGKLLLETISETEEHVWQDARVAGYIVEELKSRGYRLVRVTITEEK